MLNITEIKKYILLIWIIIASGVWTIKFSSTMTIFINFVLAIVMLIVLFSRGILRKSFLLFIISIGLIFLMIFNFDIVSWMSYAFIICFCIMGMYICTFWKKGEFLDKYTNIIFIIALVSLVMYIFRGYLATKQGGFPVINGQSISYTNFYIYLYCRELPDRNCGIFWEPGAYAVFISIALYNTLINNEKNKKFKLLVFIITLFTTQSTLAYTIILFSILLYLLKNNVNTVGYIKKIFIGILILIIVLLIMNELGAFQNIQEKLFSGLQTNASSRARNVAQLIDLDIIVKHPFTGVGFSEYLKYVNSIGSIYGQNWTMAANTFTFMGAVFGLPYLIIVGYGLSKIHPNNSSKSFNLVSILFWIWLFVSQNFMQKPILYCLIFLGYKLKSVKDMEVKIYE